MTIIDEGLYVPVTLKRFRLIESIEDAVNVPAMVESFMFVKVRQLKRCCAIFNSSNFLDF